MSRRTTHMDAFQSYLSRKNIARYLEIIAKDQLPESIDYTAERLYAYLQKGHRCCPLAQKAEDLPTPRLRNRFNRLTDNFAARAARTGRHKQVRMPLFRPDTDFFLDARMLLYWTDGLFRKAAGPAWLESVQSDVTAALRAFETLEAAAAHIRRNPEWLSRETQDRLARQRPVFRDERRGHVAFETALADGYFLVRILTPHGMKLAADLSGNCFDRQDLPDQKNPHRKRVLQTERYVYYQVRGKDNEAAASIVLDLDRRQYRFAGNHRYDSAGRLDDTLLPEHAYLRPLWETYLAAQFPDFEAGRPYGTRPKFPCARLG